MLLLIILQLKYLFNIFRPILHLQLYPSILGQMKSRMRNSVARLILAAYILAGGLLEVGHHYVHDIVLDAAPAYVSHDCGATESHVPLNKRHECLACLQSVLRVATLATHLPANTPAILCLGHVLVPNERTLHTDVLHSGKRGPPVS